MKNLHALILAAGKGTRMQSETMPKVLFPIAGKPMISYVIDAVKAVGIMHPVIVVGFLADQVKKTLGINGYRYVTQEQQLGTGHAAMSAESELANQDGTTLIVYGDQPFFKTSSLTRLIEAVTDRGATLAVMTGLMRSKEFDAFGRVITDKEGHVQKIVELKDATEEEKKVRLMNLGVYAVDNMWLWPVLHEIKQSRATGEYYLTDIVAEAVRQGKKVVAIRIEEKAEAIGINTLDHLAEAERLLADR